MGNGNSAEMQELRRELEALQKKQDEENRKLTEQSKFQWNATVSYTWTVEEEERLRKEILKVRRDSHGKEIKMNILVFGLTGHGKSTLLNSFRSAILGEGKVSHYYQPASADANRGSYTLGFCAAIYEEWLTVVDMGGVYESKLIGERAIADIFEGKVPFHATLNEHLHMEATNEADVPKAEKNNISCVVVVMKPGTELGPETQRMFQVVDRLVREGHISRRLVLTHLDRVDPDFNDPEKLPNLVLSGKVQEAIKMMTDLTGIPPSATNIVRNYVKETDTNMYSNIVLLKALESIIFDAKENHERLIARKKMEEPHTF